MSFQIDLHARRLRKLIAERSDMGRAPTVLQSEFPYNISARCINREWFQLPMDVVWRIFCEELDGVHEKHGLQIHSFVLMTNHFHLIASTPRANISICMQRFMSRTSLRLSRLGNRINETFAGRYKKTILQDYSYVQNAYKYNYRNPVKAKIVKRVEDYPYSSLQFVMEKSTAMFPLIEDTLYRSNPGFILGWLNTSPDEEKIEAVRYGMRFQYFKSLNKPLRGKGKKPVLEVGELI